MVIAPEMLSYYASIPISRLEEEVANIVASMHAAAARQAIMSHQMVRPVIRPTAYDQPLPRTDYQAIALTQARHDDVYGTLYYEDMPLRYQGHMIRDAQEVLPILDGRTTNDTHRLQTT